MWSVCCVDDMCQFDVVAVIKELADLGFDEEKLDALGEHIGFADTVTVEQLVAAGVAHRTVFELRRLLDPREVAGATGKVGD